MISKKELEQKRTPEELARFVNSTFELIRKDPEQTKAARLRKHPYKELIEEVYPLSVFCQSKYYSRQVFCQPRIGNQGFDATIESSEGVLIEIVEVTWPIDGQRAIQNAIQLNDKGHTEMSIRDVDDDGPRKEIVSRVLSVANNKALKDYSTNQGSSLLFVLSIAPEFGMHQLEHPDEIQFLVLQLKEIIFRVENVYLLLLPIDELLVIK